MNAGHKNVLLFLYIIYFFSYKIECSSRVSKERLRLLKEIMPEG
jgi:hypothetical protein